MPFKPPRIFSIAPRLIVLAAAIIIGIASAPVLAQTAPGVTVTEMKPREMVARASVSGTLVARNEVFVNTRINGQVIEALNADIGDRVKKGAVLAVLDKRTLSVRLEQAKVEQARATASVQQVNSQIDLAQVKLDQAQTSYNRNARLRETGTISQAVLDQSLTGLDSARASLAAAKDGLAVAKAQVNQAKTQVELARLNLSFTEITAPVSGIISSRSAKLGAVAAAGPEPMFRLIDNGEIEVAVDVIETEIGKIAVGDKAVLDVAGLGRLTGKVRQISPRVNQRTRLGTVRISLAPNAALRLGLFANGWITTKRRIAPSIAASAVLSDIKGDFVLAVIDGTVRKRRITTGLFWNGYREVLSGIEPGQKILLRAGAFFRDGDKVTPMPETKAPDTGTNTGINTGANQ